MVKAIEQGFPQREIGDSAYRYQRAVDTKERIIVGVNEFTLGDERIEIPILRIDPKIEEEQRERLERLRKRRDNQKVKKLLDELRQAASSHANIMYPILDATRAYATLGEICKVLKSVFGEYREPPIY